MYFVPKSVKLGFAESFHFSFASSILKTNYENKISLPDWISIFSN